MKWLYSMWWKWLSVVLLFYVLIGGMIVPLGPGITTVSPTVIGPDSVYTFSIPCYGTHFKSANAGKVQLWFKSGNNYFLPRSLDVVSNDSLKATFLLSSGQLKQLTDDIKALSGKTNDTVTSARFDAVVNDDEDGNVIMRESFAVLANGNISSGADTATIEEPVIHHNKSPRFFFPYREILYQSIRNTFYHVPMWFAMTLMVLISFVSSIMYLRTGLTKWDVAAHQAVIVALLFGACGYCTGMLWSKYTWYVADPWSVVLRRLLMEDIKLAGAVVAIAIYLAYLVLRGSITDEIKRARVSAVYNVFAIVIFSLFIFIIPRITDSLHPGNGGNPAFSKYDLDSSLRLFFYPACIGWILLGVWIFSVRVRMQFIQQKIKG